MATSPRSGLFSPSAPHWAAGPTAYLALALCAAKIARACELAIRVGSPHPFLIVPAVWGPDAMLIGAAGLIAFALGKLHRPRLRLLLTLLLLVPIALLLPSDVVSHVLTGRGLTFQRLRGDEGGKLSDLHLIDSPDLIGGLLGIAIALLAIWPALVYGARIGWVRRWARPRPLLVTLLVGFAVSLAQAAFLPRTQGLSEQPVFVLLGSFVERHGFLGVSLTPAQWRELHQPGVALPPAPPAPDVHGVHVKNVVVFLAEGVPFKATGFDPRFERGPNPTPNLTRRVAQHGLLFDDYYANWHASIQAIFSIVCSQFPPMGGDIVRVKPRIDCGELSEELAAHGVTPGLFHSGQFAFYNKLALLGRRDYAIELDAEEMKKTSKRATHEWGIDDRAMVDSTLDWVDSLHGKRFAALLIAITPHYPYWVPNDFKKPFPTGTREQRFLNGVAFQDQVFEEMLRAFEQRGLYDDTLFIWLGDHGHYVGEPERETPGLREFYEPNLHVALAFINSRMFPSGARADHRRNSRLGEHPDLMPTILDALGLPADPRHQGQSLLAPDFAQHRVFFGADDGKFVGFIEGHSKFVLETRSKRTEYYDLAADPGEQHDLSDEFTDRMQRYSKDALRFARGVEAQIDTAPVLRERVRLDDLYEMFAHNAAIALTGKDGEIACDGGECPGLGRVLHEKTASMQGEKRRCLMVRVPTTGAVELRMRDRDTLALMTGTIVALPQASAFTQFAIETTVDGKPEPRVVLSASGAVRLRHPRPQRELRLRFGASGVRLAQPAELCLQLTPRASR